MLSSQEVNLSPVKVGAAIKSMRNSDFDVYSAICEIIDNSTQAGSKNIQIKLEMGVPKGKRKQVSQKIAFGDDGVGMDIETLQQCLVLGYSKRYDDRNGIGRFGVGMILGAINVCQRVEVYSREKSGNWNYTRLDITKIAEDKDPELLLAEQRDLPQEYKSLVGDFGTLVIWGEIDRVDTDFKKEELIHRIGRIYRKSIGQQIIESKKIVKNPNIVTMSVDGYVVPSHDPLYATKTAKFPNDETAIVVEDKQFDYQVHDVDAPPDGSKTGKITIRMSLLPESWRMSGAIVNAPKGRGSAGSGTSRENNERRVNENEGISVLRNGREVYYGNIRNIGPASKPPDRFWGCEIDFEPVLDHWFSVKNIKNGARPLAELKEKLHSSINGVIQNKLRKEISERFVKTKTDEEQARTGSVNGHPEIEGEAGEMEPKPEPGKGKTMTPEEAKQQSDTYPGTDEEKEAYRQKLLSGISYMVTEDKEAKSDGNFIDIIPHIGVQEVRYNRQHPFFADVFQKIDTIEKIAQKNSPIDMELVQLSRDLKVELDRLLYAYVNSYNQKDIDSQQKIKDTMEDHLAEWSRILRRIYTSFSQ